MARRSPRLPSVTRALPVLLLCLGLPACKAYDEAKDPAAKTPTGAEAANPELEAAAPADPPAKADDPRSQLMARLVGDWRLDLSSLENDPQIAKLPPQQRMQALAMAGQMMGDVSFSFSDDGRVRLGFGPSGRVGTYTVDRVEGNALHVTTRTGTGDDVNVEQVVLRIEGDAIWVTEGDDKRTFRLLRGLPAPPGSQPAGDNNGLPQGHPPANGPAVAPGSQPSRPAAAPGSQPTRQAPASQPRMPPPQAPASQPRMPPPGGPAGE